MQPEFCYPPRGLEMYTHVWPGKKKISSIFVMKWVVGTSTRHIYVSRCLYLTGGVAAFVDVVIK